MFCLTVWSSTRGTSHRSHTKSGTYSLTDYENQTWVQVHHTSILTYMTHITTHPLSRSFLCFFSAFVNFGRDAVQRDTGMDAIQEHDSPCARSGQTRCPKPSTIEGDWSYHLTSQTVESGRHWYSHEPFTWTQCTTCYTELTRTT